MPKRIDWLPYGIAERSMNLKLIAHGAESNAALLGLSAAVVARIKAIAEEYEFAMNVYVQNKAVVKALRTWRDDVMSGKGTIKPIEQRPMFNNSPMPVGAKRGLIAEIRKYVRLIKASPGFDSAIGAVMDINTPNHAKKPLRELSPMLKAAAVAGFKVKITCQMEGMTAVQIEYRRNGEEKFEKVAFLTNLPETIYIEPRVMGVPESGSIRARFIKKNKVVGEYSNMASITLFGI